MSNPLVGSLISCLAIASIAAAQVNVIENPPHEPQSAFASPVGQFDPILGYTNWNIFINQLGRLEQLLGGND